MNTSAAESRARSARARRGTSVSASRVRSTRAPRASSRSREDERDPQVDPLLPLPAQSNPVAVGGRRAHVAGIHDATGTLATEQDVTPLALAHQALILDIQASAAERAMRRAVRSLDL